MQRMISRQVIAAVALLTGAVSSASSESLGELAADQYGPRDQAKAAGID